MKRISNTFSAELTAAGLSGLPFSWGADGTFTFSEAMSAEQKDAVLAVYAAHEPDAGPSIQAQIETLKADIDAIERKDLMNRRAREGFIIEAEERAALPPYNLTPEQLYEVQPGYRGAKDVDNQCAALRAQISALEDLL